MVSIPACHAGDRGSIPRRGGFFFVIILIFHFQIELERMRRSEGSETLKAPSRVTQKKGKSKAPVIPNHQRQHLEPKSIQNMNEPTV